MPSSQAHGEPNGEAMRSYPHLLAKIVDAPLWLHPAKAAVLYNVLAGRMGHAEMPITFDESDPGAQLVAMMRRRPQASRFVGEPMRSEGENRGHKTEPFYVTKNGIGIITVTGSLVNRGAWVGSVSDQTSYEGIKHQLARAGINSNVRSVILDMDTPGGEANGAAETAAAVRALAAKKHVTALANGMAVSAGYALASGASRIVVAPSALSGSIGTVLLHLDLSRQLDKEGITPTLIFEGAHKMDGNPIAPLSDSAIDTLRTEVKRYYELFIDTVVAGRGRKTPAKAARETEGRVFIGRDAIDARLIDDVGTFEEVLDDVSRRTARSMSATAKQQRRKMIEDQDEPQVSAQSDGAAEARVEARIAEMVRRTNEAFMERLRSISADPRVKGKEGFALELLCAAPGMSANDVGNLCEKMPTVAPSLAERQAASGAEQVTSNPPPPQPQQDRIAQGWDTAIEKANARTLADRRARAARASREN